METFDKTAEERSEDEFVDCIDSLVLVPDGIAVAMDLQDGQDGENQ